MNNSPVDSIAYCFNPTCPAPLNTAEATSCPACGTALRLIERYQAVRVLGQGPRERTLLTIDPVTADRCIIKQLWNPPANESQRERDQTHWNALVNRLKRLNGYATLPKLLNTVQQANFFYLVQEFIPGSTAEALLSEQGQFNAIAIWQLLEAVLPVLQAIHAQGMIHGDLKPNNLIQQFSDRQWRVVDVGSSAWWWEMSTLQGDRLGFGSAEYAAPEQIQGHPLPASDLYSLGVICIHLLTGLPPFDLFDANQQTWAWQEMWPAEDRHSHPKLAQLLDRLIAPALDQRLTSTEATLAEFHRLRGKPLMIVAAAPVLSWECIATGLGHEGLFASVNAVAFAPSGTLLASASDDKTLRLWNGSALTPAGTLIGHQQFVLTAAFHPQMEHLLASGSRDRTIKLWDVQQRQAIATLTEHTQAINAIAFSANGRYLASGSADKTVKLWDLETHHVIATLTGHRLAVQTVAFSPTGPLLASGSMDGTIRLWSLDTLQPIAHLTAHTAAIRTIAFSPDGNLLASGGEDKAIRLWETASWTCVKVLSGHPWSISSLVFSAAGDRLISGSWDQTLKVWQIDSGQDIAVLTGHTDAVQGVTISPDGQTITSASKDRSVKLWRLFN